MKRELLRSEGGRPRPKRSRAREAAQRLWLVSSFLVPHGLLQQGGVIKRDPTFKCLKQRHKDLNRLYFTYREETAPRWGGGFMNGLLWSVSGTELVRISRSDREVAAESTMAKAPCLSG